MAVGDVLAMEEATWPNWASNKLSGGLSRAIAEFMRTEPQAFEVMGDFCDMFGPKATYNPNGYLRKA